MGITFSSPDLDAGLATLPVSPSPLSSTSFGFDPAGTNRFGVSATVSITPIEAATPIVTFPVAGAAPTTVTCSPLGPFQGPDAGGVVRSYTGSILCDHPNSLIAPGTVSIQFKRIYTSLQGGETIIFLTDTYAPSYAFAVATAKATTTSVTVSVLPAENVAEFTQTTAVPSTLLVTPTTTLNGASDTSYVSCSATSSSLSSSASSSSSVASSSSSSSSAALSLSSSAASSSSVASSSLSSASASVPSSSASILSSLSSSSEVSYSHSYGGSKSSSVPASVSKGPYTRPYGGYEPSTSPSKSAEAQKSGYNHGSYLSPTPSRQYGHGGSCRRKKHISPSPSPAPTPAPHYRRAEGYGPPETIFGGTVTSTSTSISTPPPNIIVGATTTTTTTVGTTTVTVTTTTITVDQRTITTVNTCNGSPSPSVSPPP